MHHTPVPGPKLHPTNQTTTSASVPSSLCPFPVRSIRAVPDNTPHPLPLRKAKFDVAIIQYVFRVADNVYRQQGCQLASVRCPKIRPPCEHTPILLTPGCHGSSRIHTTSIHTRMQLCVPPYPGDQSGSSLTSFRCTKLRDIASKSISLEPSPSPFTQRSGLLVKRLSFTLHATGALYNKSRRKELCGLFVLLS